MIPARHEDMKTAIAAMKAGAVDYLVKPWTSASWSSRSSAASTKSLWWPRTTKHRHPGSMSSGEIRR
jgi:FixJ family two-component response regulator